MEEWVERNHRLGVAALVPLETEHEDYARLLAIAEQVESRIVRMLELKRAEGAAGFDVLSLLLRAYDDDGLGMTDAELIGQAAILYGAAHLTTTNSLSWTLFLLAQHPAVMRELRAELEPLEGNPPALEQLEELPVLGRVIDESLRVLTPSAYSQRLTVEPAQLGPLKLGRGTLVVFSQYITHHRPDLFDEPDRFLPERWLSIKPSPYAYLPFGAGPRMCLGATLAITTIKLALATILGRYRLTVQPGARIDGHVLSTMLTPTSGMPMLVSHADGRYEASPVTGNIHTLVKLDAAAAGPLRRAA
jgi:cytochrome P450